MIQSQSLREMDKRFITEVEEGGIRYILNEKEKTAGIKRNISSFGNILLPRSINYDSKDYLVTEILEGSFKKTNNIISVNFPKDSELRIIGKEAFSESSIVYIFIPPQVTQICEGAFSFCERLETIEIPSNSELRIIGPQAFSYTLIKCIFFPKNLEKLENGWCYGASNLTTVKIMPNNEHFMFINDQYMLSKSSPKSDKYDVLAFARRDIERAVIPSFIKKIGSYSFHCCKKLEKIEMPENCELEIIGDHSFSFTSIESIKIPPHVKRITWKTFHSCQNLKKIEIPENSELEVIERFAFFSSSIESICFPVHLTEIEERAFNFCKKLRKVEFPENSELKIIGSFAFFGTSLQYLSIPSSMVDFKEGWCCETPKLTDINIFQNGNQNIMLYENTFILGKSSLKSDTFDVLIFARRDIVNAVIPPFIKEIGPYAFNLCEQLESVEIPSDSCLQKIDKEAFSRSSIECLSFPSNVVELKDGWCCQSSSLFNINIYLKEDQNFVYFDDKFILGKSDQKSDIFDVLVFARRDIEVAIIPSFIKIIGSYAFNECEVLESVIIPDDSELQRIGKYAFSKSPIESISIPPHLTQICESAFLECQQLRHVNIPTDSELTIIENQAFKLTNIHSFTFPYHLTKIDIHAFYMCSNLELIDIPENSQLQVISKETFACTAISSFYIPPLVTMIDENAFNNCEYLQIIEIDENSELRSIDKNLFNEELIVMIPDKLKNIFY